MGKARAFEDNYIIDENDCWVWTRPLLVNGYGQFRGKRAHRWAYEYFIGPIPTGLVVDHTCRNRACVNPAHLEAVTIAENTARGKHPSGAALRGICSNGHPFVGDNVRERKHRPGVRECVQCNRDRSKRYRENRKTTRAGNTKA